MTQIALAYGAGVLATVNPCGFAMLIAYLSLIVGDIASLPATVGADANDPKLAASLVSRLSRGFRVGLLVSLGFASVFVAVAAAVSVGVRFLLHAVPWLTLLIGSALTAVGFAAVAGRHVGIQWLRPAHPDAPMPNSNARSALFGGSYALASLSCTLPILLALVAQALATSNFLQLGSVLAAYSVGAATVLTALSVSAALANKSLSRILRRSMPIADRLAGILLVASGTYLLLYWFPRLTRSGSGFSSLDSVSALITNIFAERIWLFAILGAILVAAGLLVLLLRKTSRKTSHPHW
jgi:cytochrome c-type biogenesis protein